MKKIISIPPNYFFFCLIFTGIAHFVFPTMQISSIALMIFGLILIVVGIWLIAKSYLLFKKNNTPENFDEATCLVVEGIYKYSRNPMYLGMVVFLLGVSMFSGNILAFLSPIFFFCMIHFMFIPFEEEKMEAAFGEKYLKYKRQMRRWI